MDDVIWEVRSAENGTPAFLMANDQHRKVLIEYPLWPDSVELLGWEYIESVAYLIICMWYRYSGNLGGS